MLIAGADDSGSKLFVQGFKRSGLSWVEENALAAFAIADHGYVVETASIRGERRPAQPHRRRPRADGLSQDVADKREEVVKRDLVPGIPRLSRSNIDVDARLGPG